MMRSGWVFVFACALSFVASCSGWSGPVEVAQLPIVPLPWVGVLADAGVTGTVRDGEGRAIAGAQVCAWDRSVGRLTAEDRAPRCTLAGVGGVYILSGLTAAAQRVQASAEAFQAEAFGETVGLHAGELRGAVDLTLVAGGAALQGQVVDLEGRPVAGAWVSNWGAPEYMSTPDAAAIRSDADGRFRLSVRPGGHILYADAGGFTRTVVRADTGAASTRLVLVPEAVLTGAVVDAVSGAPLAGVRVQAIVEGQTAPTIVAGLGYTDTSGAFRITRLPPGTIRLLAQTGNREGEGDRAFHVGPGEVVVAPTLSLFSLPGVRGKVVAAGNGEPCRHGLLGVADSDRMEAIGPDGVVFVPAVEPGEYYLRVECEAHPRLDSAHTVTVGRTPLEGLQFVVSGDGSPGIPEPSPARGQIRGIVVDASGQPVVGAAVGVYVGKDDSTRVNEVATGADGRFLLREMPFGMLRISAEAPTETPGMHDVAVRGTRVDVQAGAVPEVRLALPGLVKPSRGRVVQGGVPVAGALVAARLQREPAYARWAWQADAMARTDSAGEFTLASLFDGSHYLLSVHTPDGSTRALDVVGGNELRLDMPLTASLAGTAPQPGLRKFSVGVARRGADKEERLTRELRHTDGRWGFEGLTAGTLDIAMSSATACATAEVTLAEGERREDVALELQGTGALRGWVINPETQAPIWEATAYIRHTNPILAALAPVDAMSGFLGKFEAEGLCPGRHEVAAIIGETRVAVTVTIEPGRFTEVTLQKR